jgi:hypothetical protein
MTRFNHTIKSLVALLAISAVLVPAAGAQPIDPPSVGVPAAIDSHPNAANPSPTTSPRAGTDPATGFDWGAAAVGAAGTVLVMGLAVGTVAILRRDRSHPLLNG